MRILVPWLMTLPVCLPQYLPWYKTVLERFDMGEEVLRHLTKMTNKLYS